MKSIVKLLLVCSIFVSLAFSCEKITEKAEKKAEKENYFSGKIIKFTCGGTVLQFINTAEIFGETWNNWMVPSGAPVLTYPNCVLAGNLHTFFGADEIWEREGDTIFFLFNKVEFFTIGGPWCLIGGLPKTNVEISEILNSK